VGEAPGGAPRENLRIEGNTLLYERDGFEVAIESYKTTHWRVDLSIPESIGKWYPRPLDLKRLSVPEYGFVDSVETSDSYAAIGATLIIQENFQPTFEVRKVIEHLLDNAEKSEQFTEELDGKLDAAREKRTRAERRERGVTRMAQSTGTPPTAAIPTDETCPDDDDRPRSRVGTRRCVSLQRARSRFRRGAFDAARGSATRTTARSDGRSPSWPRRAGSNTNQTASGGTPPARRPTSASTLRDAAPRYYIIVTNTNP